jgi:Tripartite tricarboxylate transporter TctB family
LARLPYDPLTMKVRDPQNFATGVLYLVIGAIVAAAAGRYRIGSLARMGPGYFPLTAGVALAIVGVWIMVLALRRRDGVSSAFGTWSGRNVTIVFSSIVLFGLLLQSMGLLIAVPVLLALSSYAHPGFTWRSLLISIPVLLLVTWTIFVLLLGLPLPMMPSFLAR